MITSFNDFKKKTELINRQIQDLKSKQQYLLTDFIQFCMISLKNNNKIK